MAGVYVLAVPGGPDVVVAKTREVHHQPLYLPELTTSTVVRADG
jgi:hypothetical protein